MSNRSKQKERASFGDDTVEASANWSRPKRLECKKQPGMGYRFVRERDVKKREKDGWVIDTDQPNDEVHGLILMKTPIEKSDARYRTQQRQARINEQAARDPQQLGPTGTTFDRHG